MTKETNVTAIETRTGRSWPEWARALEAGGAADLDHAGLARLAERELAGLVENPAWWAQSIAVAYEQYTGQRAPGQAADGFQVSVSRTLPGSADHTHAAWLTFVALRESFGGIEIASPARVSVTEKWRHWRVTLADGTRMHAATSGTQSAKSTITLTLTRLDSAEEVERWRTEARALLASVGE